MPLLFIFILYYLSGITAVDMPKLGQLVLCAKDTREDRHRAIIKEINEKIVEVEFVDYYGGKCSHCGINWHILQ